MRTILLLCLALAMPSAGVAQQARQMLNGLRAEEGLGPLRPSPVLEQAAMAHAVDMVDNGFFGHDGSDGSSVGDRARRLGYGWCAIAENIAKGQGSLPDVMGAWSRSAPHRSNMLLPDVTEYGLVRGQSDVWVLVLGRDGC